MLAEGQRVEAYVAWINHPHSWGGFVDLIVLSECFQVQFSVISTESLYWTHYPNDAQQYVRRVYLLYDGIHYDAVIGHCLEGEIRYFSPTDEETLEKVTALARSLQVADDEQDIAIYTCKHCGLSLVGQAELARHSYDTGHNDYVELNLDGGNRQGDEDDEDDSEEARQSDEENQASDGDKTHQ